MYPGPDLLQEVGRVTIAGSRLDVQMGLLWHHLDRRVDFEVSRKAQGGKQCERVRRLANQRLTGEIRDEVLAAVNAAESARIRRNEIVHQDWVLRGRDAMRPVSELTGIAPEDLPAYFTEWERERRFLRSGSGCRFEGWKSSPRKRWTISGRSSGISRPRPTLCPR